MKYTITRSLGAIGLLALIGYCASPKAVTRIEPIASRMPGIMVGLYKVPSKTTLWLKLLLPTSTGIIWSLI